MAASSKPEPGTAVAVNDQPRTYALKSPIAQLLQSEAALAVLGPLIPHGMDFRQLISEVYRAGVNDPKILKCTPASIINAVATVVQTQLVVGKTIYLVPQRTKISERGEPDQYEERLQAWIDYRGDIELVVRSGAARFVDGHAVYANEKYEVTLGTQPNVVHVPIMDEKKRGQLIGGYAYAILPGRMLKVFTMTLGEVEEVRAKSRSWKHLQQAPAWYVIKSCIHRVTKTLPRNERLAKVLAIFDREEAADLGEDGEALSYTRSAAHMLPAERPRQLMPSVDPEEPYNLDASGGEQVRDVPATPAPARTAAQRARAEEAARSADPYENSNAGRGPAAYPLPFPQGSAAKGTPIGEVSDKDLSDALRFADGVVKYDAFRDAATEELERRRLAEDDETEGAA